MDDEDFEKLKQWKWYAHKDGNTFYALRYAKTSKTIIRMHRVIMNTPDGLQTDHINGDGLDNTKSNLRIVTNRQNGQNRHENKSSMFPGVDWHKISNKWRSRIRINGKLKHLGLFTTETEAYKAYIEALESLGEVFVNDIKT